MLFLYFIYRFFCYFYSAYLSRISKWIIHLHFACWSIIAFGCACLHFVKSLIRSLNSVLFIFVDVLLTFFITFSPSAIFALGTSTLHWRSSRLFRTCNGCWRDLETFSSHLICFHRTYCYQIQNQVRFDGNVSSQLITRYAANLFFCDILTLPNYKFSAALMLLF